MAHGHAHSLDARRADTRRRMWVALGLNVAMLVAEVVGGIITGSLALLADAGHVLSDVGALALGLLAVNLALRPETPRRTFGYQRTEVLAALANGLALAAIGVAVIIVAILRLDDPPEVAGGGVLALGVAGLAGNVIAALVLARGDRRDLNLEGVLRHHAADALGSVGVVIAGAVILTTGWHPIDPIVSIAIAGLIVASSKRLLVEPLNVLMEAAPVEVDVERLGTEMSHVDGVREVHDLHVWTVTAGFPALAAHVVVERGADRDLVRARLEKLLRESYEIDHTTLQTVVEPTEGLIDLDPEGPDSNPAG